MRILNNNLSSYLKLVGIVFLAVAISGYAIFQARNIILGPIINIDSPKNGATVAQSFVEIEGKTRNISYISMNDNQIFTDDKGVFREKLLLSYGYNIITIRVRDRFNREITKRLELIYK